MKVNRKISPPLSDLDKLRTPLTPGEAKLVEVLNEELSPTWEMYIQPPLNGLCPDIVLLNPNVGVVVVEVKDWNFGAMRYHWGGVFKEARGL